MDRLSISNNSQFFYHLANQEGVRHCRDRADTRCRAARQRDKKPSNSPRLPGKGKEIEGYERVEQCVAAVSGVRRKMAALPEGRKYVESVLTKQIAVGQRPIAEKRL